MKTEKEFEDKKQTRKGKGKSVKTCKKLKMNKIKTMILRLMKKTKKIIIV